MAVCTSVRVRLRGGLAAWPARCSSSRTARLLTLLTRSLACLPVCCLRPCTFDGFSCLPSSLPAAAAASSSLYLLRAPLLVPLPSLSSLLFGLRTYHVSSYLLSYTVVCYIPCTLRASCRRLSAPVLRSSRRLCSPLLCIVLYTFAPEKLARGLWCPPAPDVLTCCTTHRSTPPFAPLLRSGWCTYQS